MKMMMLERRNRKLNVAIPIKVRFTCFISPILFMFVLVFLYILYIYVEFWVRSPFLHMAAAKFPMIIVLNCSRNGNEKCLKFDNFAISRQNKKLELSEVLFQNHPT